MFPYGEYPYHLLRDLPLVQQHPEYFVPEDGLQFFQFKRRGNAEHPAITIKTAISDKDVALRIESEEVTNVCKKTPPC